MGENAIKRFRADTLTPEEITVVDKITNLPKDITGATFIMTVSTLRDPPDNTTDLFQITGIPNADQVTNKGKVDFPLTDDDADNLGSFFFDVQMKSGVKRSTVMKDRFTFDQDITKDL